MILVIFGLTSQNQSWQKGFVETSFYGNWVLTVTHIMNQSLKKVVKEPIVF
jgi:hypothetical protein